MRYVHDCERCLPLGQYGEYDLYFCPHVVPTVIARYGNNGWDYTSGLWLTRLLPELAEAKRRAIAQGLFREEGL